MDALVLPDASGPGALHRATVPRPLAGAGQVLVRVEACGLNPVDAGLTTRGNPAWRWPHVGGVDGVGIVTAIGPHVDDGLVGRRVAFHGDLRADGAFARYTVADARAIAIVPEQVSPPAAAALPCAGTTAYQSIVRRLRVAAGDTVLVTGGNGGVGGFAVQLAALAGARVIATASSRFDRPRGLGACAVVDYTAADAESQILALTADTGIDAIIDTVGSDSATRHLATLNHTGGIACIAGRPDIARIAPFAISPSVHEISLGAAYSAGRDKHIRDLGLMLAALLDLVAKGRLDPMVYEIISVDQIPDALERMRARHTVGKIVARWG